MIIISDTSGIDALIKRINEAQNMVPPLLQEAAQKSGETVSNWLKDAAPHGRGGGSPPPGEAPGSLAASFHVVPKHRSDASAIEVQTTQPLKLRYVRHGRGVVLPIRKRALYWKGLPHPVRRAGPSKPNEFVDPVLAKVDDAVKPEMKEVIKKLNDILMG